MTLIGLNCGKLLKRGENMKKLLYIGIFITITSVITTNYLKVAASVSDDRYLRESSYQSIEEYHESNTLEDETFEISFYLDGG